MTSGVLPSIWRPHERQGVAPRERGAHLLLGGILALAALNFVWQLGSSSYFIDEVLSVQDATTSLSRLIHTIPEAEKTPWTYFIFLHEWLGRTGSQTEWVARLPSAIAGLALVAAVYWMARAVADRRSALLAAGLSALSPLVLEYAQEARVYAFLMLSLALTVGFAIRGAEPNVPPGRRTTMLTAGALLAVLSMWLHYTGALVVLPLCVWLAFRANIPPRSRTAFIAGCAIGALLLVPLAAKQHNNPSGGIGPAAGVNWGSLLEVAETPFDTRMQSEFDPRYLGVGVLDVAGVVLTLGSIALLAKSPQIRHRRLLTALALCPPVLLILAGAAGQYVVNKRYAAVAAPTMLVIVAAAAAGRRRALALPIAVAAVAVCTIDSIDTHRRAGFYYPARDAIHYLKQSWKPGELILAPSEVSSIIPLEYYARRELKEAVTVLPTANRRIVAAVLRTRRPTWLIVKLARHAPPPQAILRLIDRVLTPYGYRATSVGTFTTVATFAVVLTVPR